VVTAFIDKSLEAPQDWDAIERYLKGQGIRLDREVEIRQFASGIANLNYLLSVDGKLAVFRRPPSGDLPPGAYDFARQHKVMSRLGRLLPTTPLSLAYCEDPRVIGVPFLISEFRRGIAISRELPERLRSVENIGGILGKRMVEALVQLHRISPEEAGLSDLGRTEGFILRQVRGWHRRAFRVMSEEQMKKVDALRDWLVANLPGDCPGSLIHLDFKLDNVLIDPETLTVQAIVDWEMATIGDPLYDLVMVLIPWGEPDDIPVYARLCCSPCTAPGWWSRRRAFEVYLREMGRNISDRDLKFYWLLALFRTFVAHAQLHALYARESMPNASTVDRPTLINTTLEHSLELTSRALDW
jgi:aminoglycoside phosphotransferase (APT) family kinase protein